MTDRHRTYKVPTDWMIKNGFAVRLAQAREAAGMTQTQAAEALGTYQSSVSCLEAGTREPMLQTVYQLAMLYSVSVDWLLGLSDTMHRKTWQEETGLTGEGRAAHAKH